MFSVFAEKFMTATNLLGAAFLAAVQKSERRLLDEQRFVDLVAQVELLSAR